MALNLARCQFPRSGMNCNTCDGANRSVDPTASEFRGSASPYLWFVVFRIFAWPFTDLEPFCSRFCLLFRPFGFSLLWWMADDSSERVDAAGREGNGGKFRKEDTNSCTPEYNYFWQLLHVARLGYRRRKCFSVIRALMSKAKCSPGGSVI